MQDNLGEDVQFIEDAMSKFPNHNKVTDFIPGPGIHKLKLKFLLKGTKLLFNQTTYSL